MLSHQPISTPTTIPDIASLLPIWVRGWALARGTKPAEIMPDGAIKVEVGLPDQLVRYVIPDNKLHVVERLARELTEPATWLKVCAEREQIAPLLPPRWQFSDPRFLMHATLATPYNLSVPDGYALTLTETGALTHAGISTLGGQQAAEGNLILLGRYAVFDQIGTAEAHRRKGMGRLIMQALANRALARDANQGILVATEDGQQLYRTLDWQTLSPYTSACIA
jgi:hypothetical protein